MPTPSAEETVPTASPAGSDRRGLLARLALDRPELRAWALYDWALSAMQTVITTAVFPIFFITVAGAGLSGSTASGRLALANSAALAVVAVISPVLGAMADYRGSKKRSLAVFVAIGAAATAGMFFISRGDLALASVLYALSLIGATGSVVFYESLLPHIAGQDEIDRLSTAGYALGYVGGGLLLTLSLAWILRPGWFGLPTGPDLTPAEASLPVRLAFISVAAWWVLFSVPLFRRVAEPPRQIEADEERDASPIRAAFVRLRETFHEIRTYRQAALMLLAFLFYNDGIQTIIRLATAYGTELGIGRGALITAIVVVQFVGVPCAFLFGLLADRIGAKPAVMIGLAVFAGVSVLGYFMKTATHFFALAALVGVVQGGTQALSRSLFARLIPRHKSGEFFGFYSVFEKFAGIFGPLVFWFAIAMTGSSRNAILSIIVFFMVGALVLSRVDVDAGVHAARAAESDVRIA